MRLIYKRRGIATLIASMLLVIMVSAVMLYAFNYAWPKVANTFNNLDPGVYSGDPTYTFGQFVFQDLIFLVILVALAIYAIIYAQKRRGEGYY